VNIEKINIPTNAPKKGRDWIAVSSWFLSHLKSPSWSAKEKKGEGVVK
jgi:hypothetical protein